MNITSRTAPRAFYDPPVRRTPSNPEAEPTLKASSLEKDLSTNLRQ